MVGRRKTARGTVCIAGSQLPCRAHEVKKTNADESVIAYRRLAHQIGDAEQPARYRGHDQPDSKEESRSTPHRDLLS